MKSIRIFASIPIFLFLFIENSFAIDFHGVCVGIDDYPGWVNDLNYCVNDAYQMRLKLVNEQHWDSANIDLITNSSATESNIENAIQSMPRNSSHTDLFHFSGHGSYDGVIPVDDWNYISPYELQTNFGNSYNRYVSFLDACHSGIFPDNMSRGVIESACRADEYAAETSSLQHGVFTNFLLDGLTNNSADSDGIVSAEELFYYAASKTTNYNPNQHPQLSDNWPGLLNLSLPPAPNNLTISNGSHTGENPILNWQAPISTDISGYYVYRKRETGNWQQISGKISGTSYTDDEVTIDPNYGNNYYYIVKSVDYCNAFSDASNEVSTHGYLGKQMAYKKITKKYLFLGCILVIPIPLTPPPPFATNCQRRRM